MKSIPISIPDKSILHIIGNIKKEETGGVEVYLKNISKFINEFKHIFAVNKKSYDDIIKNQNISLIHVHNLQGFEEEFYQDLLSLNIPIIVTLHDWYLICPRVQLFTPWEERCVYGPGRHCPACYLGKTRITKYLKWNNVILSRLLFLLPRIRKGSKRYKNHWKEGIKFLKMVDEIIAPSEYVKSQFESFGVIGIKHIPYGIQKINCASRTYKRRLGFVGTIAPHKGLHILLQAVKNISEDFILNIFGKIGDKEYFKRWSGLIDDKRIFYKGEENNQDRIFNEIDILVVPSLWEETYGIVIDEASSANIPVIASRIGGIPEHLIEGKSGYLFTPGNIPELRSRILYMLKYYEDIKWEFPEVMDIEKYANTLRDIYNLIRTVNHREHGYE